MASPRGLRSRDVLRDLSQDSEGIRLSRRSRSRSRERRAPLPETRYQRRLKDWLAQERRRIITTDGLSQRDAISRTLDSAHRDPERRIVLDLNFSASEFPPLMEVAHQIISLRIPNLRLRTVPTFVRHMSKLEPICMDENKLSELPDWFTPANFPSLKSLSIEGNDFNLEATKEITQRFKGKKVIIFCDHDDAFSIDSESTEDCGTITSDDEDDSDAGGGRGDTIERKPDTTLPHIG